MSKAKVLSAVFILLTIALTVFIFSNSLQVAEESAQKSNALVDVVSGFLSNFGTHIEAELLSTIIRKLGHFAEYFALGLTASAALIYTFDKKELLVFSPVYCFFTAICDEFICQAMTDGRSPEWRDCFIDLSGAILAVLSVLLLISVTKPKRSRKGDKL